MSETSFDKLKEVLLFVWNSAAPFYRKKYTTAGFDPAMVMSLKDLSRIPLLTRQELGMCNLWDRSYLPLEETLVCGYTSGTTSNELFPLVRNTYIAEAPDIESKKLLLLSMQHWRVLVQAEWFRRKGIFIVCGDIKNLPLTAELSRATGIDAIYATPTVALLIAPALKKTIDIRSIKTLLLYGESLSKSRRETLQKEFPDAVIKTHYAFSEVGPMGFSCPAESDESLFHHDPHFIYEIINPDSGEVLPEGSEGELVITTLEKMPTPLIRYKTGDAGMILPMLCSCPRQQKTFRISGRVGFDTIKVGGLELKAASFEVGVASVSELVNPDLFEVHVYEETTPELKNEVKPVLVFKLVTTHPLVEFEKGYVQDTIVRGTMVGPSISVKKAEELGYLLPSRFEFRDVAPQDVIITPKKRRILIRHA
ncbi:hypothetical protein A3D62_01580 [Candidatus Kaiserbacteria bacterium RIFCSPHIGHO2_02_FULL_49_11]|uniref:AMP-dependent synthetase/ligase domain-containing protein n=1 Tax=Candidatus Kaiserbacteria bacterium RIFCSPHIGHO2_02_FULL_49_11 TaxID=1798489 RepID=A0A1F6D1P4_9BACT|nr:MAG: hypothetical protein A3D62_01580 [Candidatus Kaiserbacteria bacterium RIFCSPHIGHO2_02_FULL_49_11]